MHVTEANLSEKNQTSLLSLPINGMILFPFPLIPCTQKMAT